MLISNNKREDDSSLLLLSFEQHIVFNTALNSILRRFAIRIGNINTQIMPIELMRDNRCCSSSIKWVQYDIIFVTEKFQNTFNKSFWEHCWMTIFFHFTLGSNTPLCHNP